MFAQNYKFYYGFGTHYPYIHNLLRNNYAVRTCICFFEGKRKSVNQEVN
jgi:hypothetical protein